MICRDPRAKKSECPAGHNNALDLNKNKLNSHIKKVQSSNNTQILSHAFRHVAYCSTDMLSIIAGL